MDIRDGKTEGDTKRVACLRGPLDHQLLRMCDSTYPSQAGNMGPELTSGWDWGLDTLLRTTVSHVTPPGEDSYISREISSNATATQTKKKMIAPFYKPDLGLGPFTCSPAYD